jgi:uncharacterized FlaG/YvyC family protein
MGMEEIRAVKTLSLSVPHVGKPAATVSRTRSEIPGTSEIRGKNVPGLNEQSPTSVAPSSSNKDNPSNINAVIEDLNQKLEIANNTLRFQIDDTTEEIKVQVVDKDTGQVVRTIPPEPSLSILSQGEFSSLLSVQG